MTHHIVSSSSAASLWRGAGGCSRRLLLCCLQRRARLGKLVLQLLHLWLHHFVRCECPKMQILKRYIETRTRTSNALMQCVT